MYNVKLCVLYTRIKNLIAIVAVYNSRQSKMLRQNEKLGNKQLFVLNESRLGQVVGIELLTTDIVR